MTQKWVEGAAENTLTWLKVQHVLTKIYDEYFQLGLQRKVHPVKNQLASLNTSN